jgi:hypothetical protein
LQVSNACFLEFNFATLNGCFFSDSLDVDAVVLKDGCNGGAETEFLGIACSKARIVSCTNSGDYVVLF